MKFGVCGNFELGAVAAKHSYDYAEWSVPNLFQPLEPDSEFQSLLESIRAARLPIEAANGLLPADLKVTGPDARPPDLEAFISTTMKRAEAAQVTMVVFGSGGARRIPDGFDRQKAHRQIVDFCRMMGPIASDHGVTVVVEPLNTAECNVLNSVRECGELVKEVDHSAIRLLVDAYHMMRDDDPVESIQQYGDLIKHVHIATKQNRLAPGAEDCDLAPFFNALKSAGYSDRVSIEGRITDPEVTLAGAIVLMKELSGS